MRIGIYSGTFDPPTNGHLRVIQEGARMFEQLRVLVGRHPKKQCRYSEEERAAMLRTCIDHLNVSIEILGDRHFFHYLDELGDVVLLRGMRDADDLRYERGILRAMHGYYGDIPIAWIVDPKDFRSTRATRVRELIEQGQWDEVEQCVPPVVLKLLRKMSLAR